MITHGYVHGMARSHQLEVPQNLGTPGAQNSVTARLIAAVGELNQGPILSGIRQSPPLPVADEDVTVSIRARDFDGVDEVTLHYAFDNPSASPTALVMQPVGNHRYEVVIPGQPLRRRVVFFITATDASGQLGRFPADMTKQTHPVLEDPEAPSRNDLRYCIYRHDNAPRGQFHNYRFYMTSSNESMLRSRKKLSNDLVDGSFVFNNEAIYFESKTRFSGSPWARGGIGGSYRVTLPRDEPLQGRISKFNLDERHGNARDMRERIAHYLIRQHNNGNASTVIPYDDDFSLVRWQLNDVINVDRERAIPPDGDYISKWYPDDNDGLLFEMDDRFVISDSGERAGGSDGYLRFPPPSTASDGDGDNRENYRWFFGLRTGAKNDRFSDLQAFAKIMDPSATTAAAFREQIWDVCDVEEFVRIWSIRANISDWDTWGTDRGKNCYLYYQAVKKKWALFAWDSELTFETGRLDQFLIPTSIGATYNMGKFSEANRFINSPRIKRMMYAVLDEMVNGDTAFFDSDFTSEYANRLSALGFSNTGVARPGGYIDQRASRIRSRIRNFVYPAKRLTISTNGGADFDIDEPIVELVGEAPAQVHRILVNGDEYPTEFTGTDDWTISLILLEPGENVLTVFGFDLKGELVDSASITINNTGGPLEAPTISAVDPEPFYPGQTVALSGTGFLSSARVWFGSVESPSVERLSATELTATVPAGALTGEGGAIDVRVVNIDGQGSNLFPTTITTPPPVFVRADANGDGRVGISDALRILVHLFSGVAIDCEDAADVNDDETLNVTDPLLLLEYLFAGGAIVPEPVPRIRVRSGRRRARLRALSKGCWMNSSLRRQIPVEDFQARRSNGLFVGSKSAASGSGCPARAARGMIRPHVGEAAFQWPGQW